ncbi:hypothetical protein A0H81_00021 [Grifola frondosa]|uniref:Uncharacterized protein n=1 Tax=Grifola frondosa TaxID=5627 RepID=A0A1C7MP16_GRIFR|nr:hypothetical protein A0H81_00021 [Grifola frondosa]
MRKYASLSPIVHSTLIFSNSLLKTLKYTNSNSYWLKCHRSRAILFADLGIFEDILENTLRLEKTPGIAGDM